MPSPSFLEADHASAPPWCHTPARRAGTDDRGQADPRLKQLERLDDWLLSLNRLERCQVALLVALVVDALAFSILALLPRCPDCDSLRTAGKPAQAPTDLYGRRHLGGWAPQLAFLWRPRSAWISAKQGEQWVTWWIAGSPTGTCSGWKAIRSSTSALGQPFRSGFGNPFKLVCRNNSRRSSSDECGGSSDFGGTRYSSPIRARSEASFAASPNHSSTAAKRNWASPRDRAQSQRPPCRTCAPPRYRGFRSRAVRAVTRPEGIARCLQFARLAPQPPGRAPPPLWTRDGADSRLRHRPDAGRYAADRQRGWRADLGVQLAIRCAPRLRAA